MAKVPQGLSRARDKLALLVCVGLSLAALSRSEEQRIELGSRWAHRITTPVEMALDVVRDGVALRRHNEQLRSRLAALELDAAYISAKRTRIEELEARAGFHDRHRGRLAPATVLERTVSRFPLQIKIRSFGDDSLRVWQPVVSADGLVGRIRQVLDSDLALVQLLTDADSRISVETAEHGVLGLLRFDGRQFLLDHVPQGEPMEVGHRLLTSGLGGTVPQGIPVGEVSEVRASASELFQHVVVTPAVRLSALTHVYVVTRPGPWYFRPAGVLPGEPGPESPIPDAAVGTTSEYGGVGR